MLQIKKFWILDKFFQKKIFHHWICIYSDIVFGIYFYHYWKFSIKSFKQAQTFWLQCIFDVHFNAELKYSILFHLVGLLVLQKFNSKFGSKTFPSHYNMSNQPIIIFRYYFFFLENCYRMLQMKEKRNILFSLAW